MVANQFLDSLNRFQCSTYVGLDDSADKLNFLYTVIILLICISTVTVKQYVLKPISCYLSSDPGGSNLLEYMENYCWVQGTIPLSFNGSMPTTNQGWIELEKQKILYYQWVPFVLGLQCIMYYLPHLVWHSASHRLSGGLDLHHLVTSANQAAHSSEEARQKTVLYVARSLRAMLLQRQQQHQSSSRSQQPQLYLCSRRCPVPQIPVLIIPRLLLGYLLVKMVYVANCVLQLCMLQRLLGLSSPFTLASLLIHSLPQGRDWQVTLLFPRVAFCYVRLRHLGAKFNGAVAQCVLPVNMLNEKIFIFLWHWIALCGLVTLYSLLLWVGRLFCSSRAQYRFVRRHLLLNEAVTAHNSEHKRLAELFAGTFLRHDGLFVLRMLDSNCGGMLTGEVILALWTIFLQSGPYLIPPDRASNAGDREHQHDDYSSKMMEWNQASVTNAGGPPKLPPNGCVKPSAPPDLDQSGLV